MLEDTHIGSLRLGGELTAHAAHVDLVGRDPEGKIVLQGTCSGGNNIGDIPDLILVTAQPPGGAEDIIAFQFPNTPTDYFNDSDRRRRLADHYEGWRVVLDQAPVPNAPDTMLRAYAFGAKSGTARRIKGEFPVPAAKP
jgi:hypothetical protein